jgi:copper(I)-binding protein
MSLFTQLAAGQFTTSDAVALTVPAGQVWRAVTITITQASASDTKTCLIGTGTTATAANVRLRQLLTTGTDQTFILAPNLGLVAGATLNVAANGTTLQANYTINGTKDLVA